ncbi:putative odorant-binding protein A10 [Copidosoma floridanum]|uniref:putative odorant-binding protein A10 n=1 Tax=Copidosoma floridanum TaxID=29053 RepID=UPI0006C96619|nr:putative odorant-binding protein A10 [Copidosoma floridanum]
MARYGAWLGFSVVLLLVAGATRAQEDDGVHYPRSWLNVDIKPIVNNERLFRKYKECLLADKTNGCPRDVVEFKRILPEVLENTCSKCLPEHITKVKEALEYICQKRPADYDEVRNHRDPTGELQAKFAEKYGKINC